jgi:hypothetical protein
MRGAGAALNGKPLRASDCARLDEVGVGLSFPLVLGDTRDGANRAGIAARHW